MCKSTCFEGIVAVKTHFETQSYTIWLDGTVEKPTEADLQKINSIIDELKSRHEDGIICYRSSKRSGYKKLSVEWRSKPVLVADP